MAGELIVFCTFGTEEEALRVANAVVTDRLAACVNVLPPIRSIYRWQENVETAQEYLLLIKTTSERFESLAQELARLHSYDTPEIIAVPIVKGSEKYLSWVRQSAQ